MAGKGRVIGGMIIELGLDSTAFGKGLAGANRDLKYQMNAMKNSMKIAKSIGSDLDVLKQKEEGLSKVIKGQKQVIKEATKAYENSFDAQGRATKETAKYATQLNNAQAQMVGYKEQLKSARQEISYQESWLRKGGAAAETFGDNVKKAGSKISGFGKGLTLGVTAPVTAFIGGVVKSGIEVRKFRELAGKFYTQLYQDAGKAKEQLDKLMTFAKTTPYAYESIVEADRALQTMGINGKEAEKTLKVITETVAGIGGSQQDLKEIGIIFGQIASSGRLNSQDMMQLVNRGIPAFKVVANELGITVADLRDKMKDGEITSEQAIKALQDGLLKGTNGLNGATVAYEGSLKGVKDTLPGAIDSFKSAIKNSFSLEIMSENVYKKLITNLQKVTDIINSPAMESVVQSLANSIASIVDGLGKMVSWFAELNPKWQEFILKGVGLLAIAGPILIFFGQFVSGIGGLIGVLGSAAGAISKFMAFGGGLSGLFSGLVGVITGPAGIIAALGLLGGVGLYKITDGFKGMDIDIGKIMSELPGKISTGIQGIKNLMTGETASEKYDLLASLGLSYDTIWKLEDFFVPLKESIETNIQKLKGIMMMGSNDEATKMGGYSILRQLGMSPDQIKVIEDTFDSVKNAFKNIMDAIGSSLKVAGDIASVVFKQVFEWVTETILPSMLPIIQKVADAFSGIAQKITDFWNQYGQQIMEAFKNFLVFISPLIKVVLALVSSFVDSVIGFVQGMVDVVMGIVKIFTGLFTGDFKLMWDGVKQLFFGAIQAIWNWISISFFGKILKGLGGFVGGFKNFISGMWNVVKSFFNGGIGDTMGKVIGWISNILGRVGGFKNLFVDFIKMLWSTVVKFFTEGPASALKNIIGWIGNTISKILGLKTSFTDVMSKMWEGIKGVFSGGIDTVFNWIKGLPKRLGKAISDGAHFVKDAFKGMFNAALKAVGGPVNAIIGGANWVLEKLGADKLPEWDVPKYARGTDGHPGGPMMVNDGRGAEAVISPNGNVMIPQGRNVTMWGAPGTHVIPAEETAMMLGKKRPKYRYKKGTGFFGALGNMASKSWDWVKDKAKGLGDLVGDVWDFVSNPLDLVKKVLGNVVDLSSLVKYPLDVAKGIVKKATDALVSKVTELFSAGDLDTGISGMQGVYKYLANVAQQVMRKFPGFVATSGYRPGDPYSHGKRNAIDIALPGVTGGSPKYTEAANYAFDKFKNQIGYVITNGKVRDRSGQSGTGVHDDWRPWPDGDHYDHVHLNGVRDPQGGVVGSGDSVGGSGVARWRNIAIQALKMEGQYSPSNLNALLHQMTTESNGNPKAINLWDPNAMKGTPSKGLMQVIDPTFRAYARPGFNKNIYDPLSNILASIRYTLATYGSLVAGWRGVGYENGGLITRQHLAMVGEGNKPEMVIPLTNQARAVQLILQALSFLGGGSKGSINLGGTDNTDELLTLIKQQKQQHDELMLILKAILMKNPKIGVDDIGSAANKYMGDDLRKLQYTLSLL